MRDCLFPTSLLQSTVSAQTAASRALSSGSVRIFLLQLPLLPSVREGPLHASREMELRLPKKKRIAKEAPWSATARSGACFFFRTRLTWHESKLAHRGTQRAFVQQRNEFEKVGIQVPHRRGFEKRPAWKQGFPGEMISTKDFTLGQAFQRALTD